MNSSIQFGAASNALGNRVVSIPQNLLEICGRSAEFSLSLAKWFLILALVAALVETGLIIWSKAKGAHAGSDTAINAQVAPDPAALAKLIEALKSLLQALTGLPAWIAIFLAGLALLWMAGQRPELCTTAVRGEAGAPSGPQRGQPTDGQPKARQTPAPSAT